MLFVNDPSVASVCDYIGYKGFCFTIGMKSLKQEKPSLA